MTIKKIIKMALYRVEFVQTIKLFRDLGAGLLESVVLAAGCVELFA